MSWNINLPPKTVDGIIRVALDECQRRRAAEKAIADFIVCEVIRQTAAMDCDTLKRQAKVLARRAAAFLRQEAGRRMRGKRQQPEAIHG